MHVEALNPGRPRWQRLTADFLKLRTVQGNAAAPYRLGMLYLEGKIMPEDREAAINYLKVAAERGHRMARQMLKSLRT